MLRNYFSIIGAYKQITQGDLRKLEKEVLRKLEADEEIWCLVKKRRWLSHKGWFTTIYRGRPMVVDARKGTIKFWVGGSNFGDLYKCVEGEHPSQATSGLSGCQLEEVGGKDIRIFRWDAEYALEEGAEKPVFTARILSIIHKYL